jgi:hypothetical protein
LEPGLKAQHQELQVILAKRSDAKPDPDTIVKEFAAVWLPHIAVEREVLAPALRRAGIDSEKGAAGAIQKDVINWLLADLLRGGGRQFGQAKLDALAKHLDAHVAGADIEETGMLAHVSTAEQAGHEMGAQVKAYHQRLKSRFANMDESIGEALDLLAPQRLSAPIGSQRNRRESEMNRYSNMRERDDHGRFTSDDDNGYSRSARTSG